MAIERRTSRGMTLLAASYLLTVIFCAAFPGTVAGPDPLAQNAAERLLPPGPEHPFGTDGFGRDVFSRTVHGASSSVFVGFSAVALAALIGISAGMTSAYFGGKVDLLLQRVIDTLLGFPFLVFAIIVVVALEPSSVSLALAIGIGLFPHIARTARAATLSLREEPYILAARMNGLGPRRIMMRHLLPNITPVLAAQVSGSLGTALSAEATMSFLGLGVPPPYPSWGRMLQEGSRQYFEAAPWVTVFPGIVLALTVLSFMFLGDALRDLMDPRRKGGKLSIFRFMKAGTARALLLVSSFILFAGNGLRAESAVPPVPAPAYWESSDGFAEMYALTMTYPDRITAMAFRNGDWSVEIDGTWYSWANSRILPEHERRNWRQYQSIRFYRYPLTLPPIPEIEGEAAESMKERVRASDANPPQRHERFLGALYRAADREETLRRITEISFMGFRFQGHERIAGPLAELEEDLLDLSARDGETAAFFDGIRYIGAFNWRNIVGTESRSYHSYGLALDFVPYSYGRKHAYWRWAMDAGIDEWWAVPYEKRWMVPLSVVQAFEMHGFIWGGKWLYYDTIHFEYRPEVLNLARIRENVFEP